MRTGRFFGRQNQKRIAILGARSREPDANTGVQTTRESRDFAQHTSLAVSWRRVGQENSDTK